PKARDSHAWCVRITRAFGSCCRRRHSPPSWNKGDEASCGDSTRRARRAPRGLVDEIPAEVFKEQVNYRRGKQSKSLGNNQTANDGNAEGLPQLGTGTEANRQRHCSK